MTTLAKTNHAAIVKNALALAHSIRFRPVTNRYPRRVAEAYKRDLAAAMRDTDEQVAAKVAAWERQHGLEVQDWQAISRSEGRR